MAAFTAGSSGVTARTSAGSDPAASGIQYWHRGVVGLEGDAGTDVMCDRSEPIEAIT